MGRKLTKPRPAQGAHLARLRKAAGLSQAGLARLIGQTQGNIAFWEVSDKPPRSDVLPKLAQALNVSLEALLTPIKPAKTPTTKLQRLFNQIAKLPDPQQQQVIALLSLLLKQFKPKS